MLINESDIYCHLLCLDVLHARPKPLILDSSSVSPLFSIESFHNLCHCFLLRWIGSEETREFLEPQEYLSRQ